jgi:hypothetical protein
MDQLGEGFLWNPDEIVKCNRFRCQTKGVLESAKLLHKNHPRQYYCGLNRAETRVTFGLSTSVITLKFANKVQTSFRASWRDPRFREEARPGIQEIQRDLDCRWSLS